MGKLLEHKHRLICVKVSCNDHKLDILSKSPSLKASRIFRNEDLIPEDEAELRKEIQKVKGKERKANGQSLEIGKVLLEIESKIKMINKN